MSKLRFLGELEIDRQIDRQTEIELTRQIDTVSGLEEKQIEDFLLNEDMSLNIHGRVWIF